MTTRTVPSKEAEALYLGPLEIRHRGEASEEPVFSAAPDVRLVAGVVSYLHHDQLGSVTQITDAGGVKAREVMYYPFGQVAYEQVLQPATTDDTRGFIGQRYDEDAGLQYLAVTPDNSSI